MTPAERTATNGPSLTELRAKIGQLTMENDFLQRARSCPRSGRKAMIDRTAALRVMLQCELLQVSRFSVYRPQRELPEADLALMRRIDALHLEYSFLGSRQLRDCLRLEARRVWRKRVQRLMRVMGITLLS